MTLHPFHARTLARLVAGLAVNGELQALPTSFGPIGRRLADLPPGARLDAWNGFLDGRDDRDAIINALAAIDPEGPPPEAHEVDDLADDWGPIRFGTLPPAEPFPIGTLPIPARDLAEAAARSIGCPVDFPAAAILAAASGLIGRSASLLVKPGYFESAGLFLALVGGPSSGKSPAIRAALAPIRGIGGELHAEWRKALDAWNRAPEGDRGDRPALARIDTSDPTTEALGPILAANPRGLIVTPDEMTKWIMGMDQYKGGKGGDRPFYLSAWGGEPVTIDRAKHASEPIVVPHPFLTVVGGMTPGMLGEVSEGRGREDGFSARLLFCYPDRVPRPYTEDGIPEAVAAAWHDLALSLRGRPMRDLDGRAAPHAVKMSPEARREWREWCQAHRAEQEADDFPASLEGSWGKLEAYAARLALILHLMDLAADPTRPADDEPPDLPRRIIQAAARLVGYFKAHARRIRATTGGKSFGGGEDVRALLGWVIRNDHAWFSTQGIGKDFDRFKDDEAALSDALSWMTDRNLIRLEPADGTRKPGRKRSPRYEANPALWKSPRFRQFRQNGPSAPSFDGNDGNAVDREESR